MSKDHVYPEEVKAADIKRKLEKLYLAADRKRKPVKEVK